MQKDRLNEWMNEWVSSERLQSIEWQKLLSSERLQDVEDKYVSSIWV
jgi:hypothetical protein